jgi:hypothetical protein
MSMPEKRTPSPGGGPPLRHEPSDVGARGLLLFTLTLLFTVALIMLIAKAVLDHLIASRPQPVAPVAAVGPSLLPPVPRLQSSPDVALHELRTREDQEMTSYAWVDRQAGLIRLPVDRALELVANRGVPSWKAPESPAPPRGREKK